MTAEQLIKVFELKPETRKNEDGQEELTGRFFSMAKMTDEEMQEIRDHLDEINTILSDRWTAKRQAEEDRQAKIDAIEGLQEIQDAIEAAEQWQIDFNKSFEGEEAVGGMGVGPKPNTDIEALKARYPRAAAYLKAQDMSFKTNYEMAIIGRDALERIINEPDNYNQIIEEMDGKLDEFSRAHMWD